MLPDAVDIFTTTFISDVACETCQCNPVALEDAGIRVTSMTKFLTER